MLERRLEARHARSVFFRWLNDVDVYVEDNSKETKKLYALLLTRAFGGEVDVSCVFPLGTRQDVIRACERDVASDWKRVYVIDADLEMCVSSRTDLLPRLFVLPRYCIENFLISGAAAAEVVAQQSLELTRDQAAILVNFDGWLQGCARPLRRLFMAYAVVHALEPRMPTVSLPLRELLSDDSGYVDGAKVEQRISHIRTAIDSIHGQGVFDAWYEQLGKCHVGPDDAFVIKHVSGKGYLLPLLRMLMHRVERMSKSTGLLKLDLARHAEVDELRDLVAVAQL